MKVKDVMTTEVNLVAPDTSLFDAAKIMRERGIGILPIGENDRLVGMLTDRDIVVRGIASNRDMKRTAVRDVMSAKILYCYDDQSVEEACANMGSSQVRRLPVVNRDKRLVGIVSLGDIALHGAAPACGEALERISAHAS
jgi:CBS domain-containing protein